MVRRPRDSITPIRRNEHGTAVMKRSEFVEYIVETMRLLGPVEAKAMFGGWGLYHGSVFFALVAFDTLYLKVDEENRARFEAEGLEPFVFEAKDGRRTVMSYRRAPDEALENAEVMEQWARLGYEAALRAAAAKAKPARPRRSPGSPRRGN
jgi:DNA transformation protein